MSKGWTRRLPLERSFPFFLFASFSYGNMEYATKRVLRPGRKSTHSPLHPRVHRIYIYIPSFFFFNILDISRIIYSKLMYKLRVAPHANILEICCNPVDEFHLWLMYINITRCVTLNGQ